MAAQEKRTNNYEEYKLSLSSLVQTMDNANEQFHHRTRAWQANISQKKLNALSANAVCYNVFFGVLLSIMIWSIIRFGCDGQQQLTRGDQYGVVSANGMRCPINAVFYTERSPDIGLSCALCHSSHFRDRVDPHLQDLLVLTKNMLFLLQYFPYKTTASSHRA